MSVERTATLAVVWTLIAYEFVTYTVLFVPGFFRQYPLAFCIVYPVFLLLVVLLVITYYKSIVVPPGSPPPNINAFYSDIQQIKRRAKEEQEIKKAIHHQKISHTQFNEIEALQKVSYCFKCDRIKPVRAHHCKICGTCVLRMDHHCPWVGNCVGLKNQKYFMQFLLYSSSALAIVFWTIAIDFLKDSKALEKQEEIARVLAYLGGLSSGCLSLSIGFLFISQLYILAKNLTTLESFVQGMEDVCPWRKPSFSENVQQIAGTSSWFWPSNPFPHQTHYMPIQL